MNMTTNKEIWIIINRIYVKLKVHPALERIKQLELVDASH